MELTCNICSETKDCSLFPRNRTRKNGYANRCKACQKSYSDKSNKKASNKLKRKQERAKKQAFINRVKTWRGCSICGYKAHAVAIDFDHLDPSDKRGSGYSALCSSWSIKRIKEEMRKCRILCSNCHRCSTHGLL